MNKWKINGGNIKNTGYITDIRIPLLEYQEKKKKVGNKINAIYQSLALTFLQM